MHLHEVFSFGHMSHKLGLFISLADRIKRKPHGKDICCVLSEHFPVKEIAPAAYGLPEYQSRHGGIGQHKSVEFLPFCEYKCGKECAYNTTVDCDAALPYLKDVQGAVFVILP